LLDLETVRDPDVFSHVFILMTSTGHYESCDLCVLVSKEGTY